MSGDVTPGVTRSFASADDIDFGSSAGIKRLLSVVRNTKLNRSDYNELRDLIFKFKQSGDSNEVKSKIVELLVDTGVLSDGSSKSQEVHTPNAVPEKTTEENSTKMPVVGTEKQKTGNTRPKPLFGRVKLAVSKDPNAKVVQEKVADDSGEKEVKLKVNETTLHEEVSLPSQEDRAEVVEPQVAVDNNPTYEDPLERIKEIKKQVNLLVGNPVNLIDANNEVGREYMNALLEAMKKVNGGSKEEVNTAMTRLEKAFLAVKGLSQEDIKLDTAEARVSEKTEQVEKESEPEVAEVDREEVVTQESSAEVVEEVNKVPDSEDVYVTEDIEIPDHSEVPKVPEAIAEVSSGYQDKEESKPITVNESPLPKSRLFSMPITEDKTMETEPGVSQAETSINDTNSTGLTSMAEVRADQAEHIEHVVKEAKSETLKQEAEIASMDPLLTPDVDNGLSQLLSEWKLFKSSGIFGTGPSGLEHPLYKKLANTQMTAVITGRFEGATPEIKQSITDYMNGWRYEEGIVHEHGETFEHYLRRVIRKILDKHKVS